MMCKLQRILMAQSSFFVIFALAQSVFGQQTPPALFQSQKEDTAARQCALTMNQLPEFHGLRLGMPEAEVRNLFRADSRYREPESYFSAEGHLRLCMNDCEAPVDKDCLAAEPARFPGIAVIHFTHARGQVEMITVYFETGAMPANALAFSSIISDSLRLPRAWHAHPGRATMECQGFRVRIEGGNENKLALLTVR